jgi:hypothetical protein
VDIDLVHRDRRFLVIVNRTGCELQIDDA